MMRKNNLFTSGGGEVDKLEDKEQEVTAASVAERRKKLRRPLQTKYIRRSLFQCGESAESWKKTNKFGALFNFGKFAMRSLYFNLQCSSSS